MKILFTLILAAFAVSANAQCNFVRANSNTAQDTLTYTFNGGTFESYGCAPIDPTYWMSGGNMSVQIDFPLAQTNPKIRVWGMNDNDTATVQVNGNFYALNSQSAAYDTMVICGVVDGNGVVFANDKLAGTSSGNYSYQDITILASGVTSITVNSQAGLGWGFAGVTVCKGAVGVNENNAAAFSVNIYPNPTTTNATLQFGTAVKNASLAMYNTLGQLVYSASQISGTNYVVNSANLPAGIYTVVVLQDGQKLATKRLVVAQ